MNKVSSNIRYICPGVDRPVYTASQGGSDAALSINVDYDDRQVTVYDARQLSPAASLDKEGFCLLAHTPQVKDFYKLESQRASYEADIIKLVLNASGGSGALVFDHTLRSDSPDVRGQHSTREPASIIHNDYSDASAEKRLRELLSANEAETRLASRYAIINVWRSIRGPVLRSPLALCDYSSALSSDFVATERRAAERIGELELVTWNPDHRWFYFPEQKMDEALLIKTFDSATDGRARRVAHTAFDHPETSNNTPPRESLESRLLVFFD